MITLGLAGKPNCGKSTFFKAATLANVEIANYPFTTIDANHGVAYARSPCVCRELGTTCGVCRDGVRFIPIGLIDVAGLVPEAHKGRGLGNQFLDHLRQADGILHILDASGSTDAEGNPVGAGTHNPAEDIEFLEYEMSMWLYGILEKHWSKIQRSSQGKSSSMVTSIAELIVGLGITIEQVKAVELESGLDLAKAQEPDLVRFCRRLLSVAKPMMLVGNRVDEAPDPLVEALRNKGIQFATSAGELALQERGLCRHHQVPSRRSILLGPEGGDPQPRPESGARKNCGRHEEARRDRGPAGPEPRGLLPPRPYRGLPGGG